MAGTNKGKKTIIKFMIQRKGTNGGKSITIETDEFAIDSRETFEVLHNSLFMLIESYKEYHDLR